MAPNTYLVYSRSRIYKTMKLTHCVVGDVRNDLAACILQRLTQELLEEREKEKEAPWKLFNCKKLGYYIRYIDCFC